MKYTIVGSVRSPFVRMLRIFMESSDIPFDFKVIDYLENPEDQAYLAKVNPINRIPLLLIDDEKLFDSRVIYNYLTKNHNLKTLSLSEENYLSTIISAIDVSVNLFLLKRGGLDLEQPNWYIERQKSRLQTSLAYTLDWVKSLDPQNANDWNYASMALYSYLGWAKLRNLLDFTPYPEFEKFLTAFKKASGVAATEPK